MPQTKECTNFMLDTCFLRAEGTEGTFLAGAVTYRGRKRMETIQWKDEVFTTKEEADRFVREHFAKLSLKEVSNEEELKEK